MGSGPDIPEPTAEEQALHREQLELMQFQRAQIEQQSRTMELLAPVLYGQVGLQPIYSEGTPSTQVANPQRQRLEQQIEQLLSQRGQVTRQVTIEDVNAGRASIEDYDRNQFRSFDDPAMQEQIAQLESQLAALPETVGSGGTASELIGFEEIVDPLQEHRERIEELLLERTEAALEGELPVNPALVRDLKEQEEELHGRLRENLGRDYSTSTPGIEALAEFDERENIILEGARRGDLSATEALSLSRNAQLQGANAMQLGQRTGIPQSIFSNPGVGNLIGSQGGMLDLFYRQRANQQAAAAANDRNTMAGLAGIGGLAASIWTGNPAPVLLAAGGLGGGGQSPTVNEYMHGSGFSNLFRG